MKKVLNNWITDRLNDFEKRQEESMTNIEVWSRMNDNAAGLDASSAVVAANSQTNLGLSNVLKMSETRQS